MDNRGTEGMGAQGHVDGDAKHAPPACDGDPKRFNAHHTADECTEGQQRVAMMCDDVRLEHAAT